MTKKRKDMLTINIMLLVIIMSAFLYSKVVQRTSVKHTVPLIYIECPSSVDLSLKPLKRFKREVYADSVGREYVVYTKGNKEECKLKEVR